MKIEQQVCNLELAKKLKALGVKSDYLYHYIGEQNELSDIKERPFEYEIDYPAYTATELLEMLPSELEIEVQKTEDNYIVVSRGIKTHIQYEKDANLCNALTKMLIYLKTNNLIKN